MNISVSDLKKMMHTKLSKLEVEPEKAANMVDILVEGELLAHRTHGIALFRPYVEAIIKKEMRVTGTYTIINQSPVTELWDGDYLSGTWLVIQGLERASQMAEEYGMGTVVIQKSHHIACLSAYLEGIARTGLMVMLTCSDPMNKTVAPFGGSKGIYSPNPIALGIPTSQEPILLDISTSSTANGFINRAKAQGQKLPQPWLQKPDGQLTDDPETFFAAEPSTILPLGGADLGYKGFAFGIMVEALTNALGGYGRTQHPDKWGASVFIQVINPNNFCGESAFLTEIDGFVKACQDNKPINEQNPVRLPGQGGLVAKQQQLKDGIAVDEEWWAWLQG